MECANSDRTSDLSACAFPRAKTSLWRSSRGMVLGLVYTQGFLNSSYFVAFVMFLVVEWQLKYSSVSEETQLELADIEIRMFKKLLVVEHEGFSGHTMTEWLRMEGTSWCHLAQTPAQAGPLTASCSGPCPDCFWISPWKEAPSSPWQPVPVLSDPHSGKVFLDG